MSSEVVVTMPEAFRRPLDPEQRLVLAPWKIKRGLRVRRVQKIIRCNRTTIAPEMYPRKAQGKM